MSVSGKRLPLVLPEGTRKVPQRLKIAVLCAVLMANSFVAIFPSHKAYAAQITTRSLTLQAGVTDGGSKPGGLVNHKYDFTIPSNTSVGSIQFLYCTTASGSCTAPAGLVTTSATMGAQTGATGFTLNNTTNGAPYVTRVSALIAGPQAVSYQLLGVVNPTTTNQTFFVRIATFASTDTSGSAIDTGNVTASTATQILLDGIMPESLIFCTGRTVSATSGVPDCTTATDGAVSFNRLFSPTDTATATSQMVASTNAGFGFAISVNGPTLTSGSNTITPMSTATAGIRGLSQFGLNLRANTVSTSTPAVGIDIAPAPNGTNYRGEAVTGYDTVDSFKFVSTNTIADSANGGAGGTDAQIFTASYIVNVPGSQPAGTYSTTLTYICTPTF
jgi:hypothetical protein